MAEYRLSAAYRIAFLYSASFAAAILVLGVVVYFAADAEFRRTRDATIAEEVATLLNEGRGGHLGEEIASREAAKGPRAFLYALFDRRGRRIAGSLDTAMPPPGWGQLTFQDPSEGEDHARARTVALGDGGRLVVAVDSETIERIDATILTLFAGAFAVVLALGLAGALWLGRYLRGRLLPIRDTARAIVAGDFAVRVPRGARADEFDEVAAALNTMLDRIDALMANLRQVSSDVAHDLRTPLLRLRNQLDQVGHVEGAAERAIALGDELLRLFGAILRISEVEGGGLVREFVPLDLSALVREVGETFEAAIVDGGRRFAIDVAAGVTLAGHRELLAQAIANLLDNAALHTPPGTEVVLALTAAADGLQLSVADNGPGVVGDEVPRLARRFYRGSASRTTPGNGLGLSLVQAVAELHGGQLHLMGDAGFVATLRLPRD